MMKLVIASSLRFRYLVLALGVVLTWFGLARLKDVPVDVFPEFAPPRVEIQTICLGLSSAEVEQLVTVPLENALNGVPDIDVMRSKSVGQLSSILLIFKSGVDSIRARQLVSERMALASKTLPTWAAPPFMMPPLSSTSRIMKIGITSQDKSVMDLSMLAYWTIRQRLLGVPGVANVAIWGEQLKMLQVMVDPNKMAAADITLDQVQEAVSDALDVGLLRYSRGAHIGTGGFVETPNQRFQLIFAASGVTPETLSKVPVTTKDGKPLLLNEVADLVYAPQGMIGDAVINDGPGLMLIVEKFPWGNTLAVTRGVEDALEKMKPGLPGVEIDTTIFRPATFVEDSIDNLSRALLLSCLLVTGIIVIFLYEWRTAIVCIVAIPLSLLAAALVLFMSGATVNTMTLAGFVIALGIVVDDAILDVENIMRRLRLARQAGDTRSTARIVLDASLEVRAPIVSATLIVVAAVVPVLFMQGLTGSFFKPLIGAYVLAIAASLIVAMTATPALCLILLDNARLEGRESPLVVWLRRHYPSLLERVTRTPRPAFITVGAVTLAGIAVWPLLGHSLLPSFKERDFLMHWVTSPDTSLPEMLRITTRASKELRAIPGVRNFGAHIGQAFAADEVVGVNFGENWISISKDGDYEKTHAKIDEMVEGYPGLYRDVQTYLKERIREVLTGTGEAIVVRIFGPDLDVLRNKAEEVRAALADVPNLVNLHKELIVEVPHIQVTLKLEEAQRYGLKPGDARRASATLMAGEEVGDIFLEGRTYDVQVWTPPEFRRSVDSVRQMQIDTPTGQRVRLAEVANVDIQPTPNIIRREASSRRIDVEANVRGRDLAAVAQDVQARLDKLSFPLGYYSVLQGEYQELRAARARLEMLGVLALAVIFVLLQQTFGSWRLATLSFLTLPSALVGGILAAWLAGGIVSLGSLIGFLTVLGIAARNGIIMINHFQHLERYEGAAFGMDLVLRGANERLRPILMTTGAAGLAILPLIIFGNLPGHEIEYPMAVVIMGGLVTSTLLNLFILPALYLRFGRGTVGPTGPEAVGAYQGRAT
ncbi:efflux RND transporter permease subunit [Bradyrhizobium japonicum]|uniref:CzcA family heavy metal efflux pump n=3 Tax=Bradyrhizobium japonicum TaxID=375 RepID=A0ABV2S184_BRAJP|nr:efflux RND transporter permease subunit [Bradyrhizobium japonicum]MCP1767286.1 CzcA family heavy metal efflux pump [Bradyrhizobium japonicum]MCP1789425.1 CzcA family heavy metal efflux pump [Bradyrhizobium japonicum]MCP1801924.1 CzcA family heavy metal efflux pump [Bradyrhizobium japonicum]MCP1820235.1 CzcA family heavy metal efflux pump [Bradyrhizobium japonicum]MCP1868257.1 CzcA family heavy metal efflux pump [Bradyrhizobium japonicum]